MEYFVPDTDDFSLRDVTPAMYPFINVNDLRDCKTKSRDDYFDSRYEGDRNSLKSFRNYGPPYIFRPNVFSTVNCSIISVNRAWATARNGTGTKYFGQSPRAKADYRNGGGYAENFYINRGFFAIDLVNISCQNISYEWNKELQRPWTSGYSEFYIYSCPLPFNTVINLNHWNEYGIRLTERSSNLKAEFTTEGLAYIEEHKNDENPTMFMLRHAYDVENIPPTNHNNFIIDGFHSMGIFWRTKT